jgi:F-type H+-transporting ATPase subunit b
LEALSNLGINPIYLLSQIVTFGLLAFLLSRLLYNPILNMLETRRERIAQGLEDARAAEEARAKADEEASRIIEEARKRAQQLVAEANTSAEQVRSNIEAQAEEERRKILAQARQDAEAERDQVLSEMREQIGALAIAAAERILADELDPQRQNELVRGFFSGIKSGEILVLKGEARLDGQKATVTTAVPLTEEEKERYQAALRAQLGSGAEVGFATDPSILGGVVVRVGDQVIDDSVVAKLEGMRTRLSSR